MRWEQALHTTAGAVLALAVWAGPAAVEATRHVDRAQILSSMSGSPPADKAVAFTVRLQPGPGSDINEEQVALAESTGSVLLLTYQAPVHLKGHVVLVRNHRITYRPRVGRTSIVSGTYRHFGHVPLARLASVLLVNPADAYAVTHEPDVQVGGQTRTVVVLTESVAAGVFERIEVQSDPGSGLPLEARAISIEDQVEWAIRYQFDNRLATPEGSIPYLSAVEVSQTPSGSSWVLRIEGPFLIDRWKVPRELR